VDNLFAHKELVLRLLHHATCFDSSRARAISFECVVTVPAILRFAGLYDTWQGKKLNALSPQFPEQSPCSENQAMNTRDIKTQRATHQQRAPLKARSPPRFSQQIVWAFVAAFGIV